MANAEDKASSFERLLNTSTPFAASSEAEIAERMSAAAGRHAQREEAEDRPGDPPSQPEDAGTGVPGPGQPFEVPRAEFDAFELFDGMRELMTELQGFTSALESGLDAVSSATGEDATGTIQVTIRGDGSLGGLSFLRSWRKKLTPETFDAAVLEAISNATLARLTTVLSGVGDSPLKRPATPPPMPSVLPVRPPDFDAAQAMRLSHELFAEFTQGMRELELEGEPVAPAGVEVRSEKGRVTLTIAGGAVAAVAVQQSWLKGADQSRISEEVRTAFEAANRLAESGPVTDEALAGSPGLQRLTSITRELQELSKHIGFPGQRGADHG